MIHSVSHPHTLAPLFAHWPETIIWSCLQGVMGAVYAPAGPFPASAAAVLGDFVFLSGVPNRELIEFLGAGRPYGLFIPRTSDWLPIIQEYFGERVRKITRYAIKKEPSVFDPKQLSAFANHLPSGCQLQLIDADLYRQCLEQDWSRDLVSQYGDYDTYRTLGLGVGAVMDGRLVSGASSYSSYQGGIEVEIDTHPDYRRRGLALACGARLILKCLSRNLYPSWDAHTEASLSLAEKLGYHRDYPYPAYEIWGP